MNDILKHIQFIKFNKLYSKNLKCHKAKMKEIVIIVKELATENTKFADNPTFIISRSYHVKAFSSFQLIYNIIIDNLLNLLILIYII